MKLIVQPFCRQQNVLPTLSLCPYKILNPKQKAQKAKIDVKFHGWS